VRKTAKRKTKGTSPRQNARSPSCARRKKSAKSTARPKKLVIVESPAKARTINRYLGSEYLVKASMGHVRDLPRKSIAVDVAHGFRPTYVPLERRKKTLTELKRHAKTAPCVYLATDLDREGEAIAWHLAESLGVPRSKIRRVIFNEITRPAIDAAFAHPHQIDMNKVNAQQARRILDRIVGYEISPLLWRKVSPGLSAGRVQSVAVRLIVEREREIDAFDPQEYWKIGAVFTPDLSDPAQFARNWREFLGRRDGKGNPPTREEQGEFLTAHNAFRAELVEWKGAKAVLEDSESALEVARSIGLVIERTETGTEARGKVPAERIMTVTGHLADDAGPFRIRKLSQKKTLSRPPGPFTTASMQQAAAVQLRYSASRTMRLAQQLYEGVEIPGEGSVGLITYMRTDSMRVAPQAVDSVRSLIAQVYGEKYLPETPRSYSSGGRAQEAHEAIRPSDVTRRPEDLRGTIEQDVWKLYELIWRRFVASQMSPAVWKVTEAAIVTETPDGTAVFKAIGRTLAFKGFLAVANRTKSGEQIIPPLQEEMIVAAGEIAPTQHFTHPPPRYTEASLVKALEADGIGRPSTYAMIIQTIQDRGYVEQIQRAFHPTDLGIVVTDKLVAHFPKVLNIRFTAHMEDELDRIEEAEIQWVSVLEEFYGPFSENLQRAREEMVHAKAEEEPSDYTCETCGKPMVYRFARNGRYLACTGYPECKTTYPVDKEGKKIEKITVNVACLECGSPMVLRRGRYGPFLSCSNYPECKGTINLDRKGHIKRPSIPPLTVDLPCPKCGSALNLRRSKRGPWLSCSKYPKCRGRAGWKTLTEAQRKALEKQLRDHEAQHPLPVIRTLDGAPIDDQHVPVPLPEAAADVPKPKTTGKP